MAVKLRMFNPRVKGQSVQEDAESGTPSFFNPLRGCEEIELSDVDGSPSPHPSPGGRGRLSGVTCTCISHSTKKMHGQVTLTARPLPRGEGRGEGLPAMSDRAISSHPLRANLKAPPPPPPPER